MTVSYTPSFTHTDWVDNQDRVQAGGSNGFNGRFHGIEAEFAALQLVVQAINDALTALSTKPPPQPQTTAFTPNLVPTVNLPNEQWQHQDGIAYARGQASAVGMMDVQLPNGSTVNSLRVIGNKGSGNVNVTLRRQPIADGSAPQTVAIVSVPNTQNGTFDTTAAANPATSLVDTGQFRYYVSAALDSADPGAAVGVVLDAFLVTHTG
jgi:hypothetical protein